MDESDIENVNYDKLLIQDISDPRDKIKVRALNGSFGLLGHIHVLR